ncbi:MAG: hypothetical protein Q9163_001434 [Psora crenata]
MAMYVYASRSDFEEILNKYMLADRGIHPHNPRGFPYLGTQNVAYSSNLTLPTFTTSGSPINGDGASAFRFSLSLAATMGDIDTGAMSHGNVGLAEPRRHCLMDSGLRIRLQGQSLRFGVYLSLIKSPVALQQ